MQAEKHPGEFRVHSVASGCHSVELKVLEVRVFQRNVIFRVSLGDHLIVLTGCGEIWRHLRESVDA